MDLIETQLLDTRTCPARLPAYGCGERDFLINIVVEKLLVFSLQFCCAGCKYQQLSALLAGSLVCAQMRRHEQSNGDVSADC